MTSRFPWSSSFPNDVRIKIKEEGNRTVEVNDICFEVAHPDLMAEVMLMIFPNNAPPDMIDSISYGAIDQLTDQLIENTKSSVTSYFSVVTDYTTSFSVAKVALKAVDSSLELVDGVVKKSDE